MTDTIHYVATLKIEKVTRERPGTNGEPKRGVDDVTQLTIKADNLPLLVAKLGKHIAIVEE